MRHPHSTFPTTKGNSIMFKKSNRLAVFALLGITTLASGLGATSALSFPLTPSANAAAIQPNEIVPVQYMQHHRMDQNRGWDMHRDGNRCRSRFGNCRHFYQGYYYETPWWTVPFIIGDKMTMHTHARGSHVQWCLSRYRSYNPRTDLWLGLSGRQYRCNSPF
jgi:BA14K-like protein